MGTIKVNLAMERETLLLTLYTRALDSCSNNPILGDKKAMEIAQQLDSNFKKLKIPTKESFGGAIRAKYLDVWTKEFLVEYSDATVLELGCGLDSRMERVCPPKSVRWFDLDFPDVIELRRHFFSDREGYCMIGSSLTDPFWLNEIPSNRPVIIIADGVLPFLTENDVKHLFVRLTRHFQSGQIAFNGYTRFASRMLKYHPSIKAIGGIAPSNPGFDDPREPEKWSPHLKLIESQSIVGSPYIAETPWTYRFLCGVMNSTPSLKKEGGWMLRYRFSH
ncbi:class I SAM-dependent methyltransferase [Paenibacillus piri]|uniref:Class I SAM-dependent methyltransferase n=1 Tax=Paenibacillus piri TaxID=2547395 RepID=A0A4R5KED5_9BACL|nr:class I SAM-dependent methyltransferase [Paenibacillus piri]TDF92938.1 class I SAM-dependent methyltransferase [Paenibacillus piri]